MSDEGTVLQGMIDLHVHAGPDVRPRKMSAWELAHCARQAGMRGLLLKNHHASTVKEADVLSRALPELHVFGGLVLNDAVGGLNPEAVDAALKMGAAAIWMPTKSSANERSYNGEQGGGISVLDSAGKLTHSVNEILELVAENDVILGTGHLSPPEIAALVAAGRQIGVRKFLINHPEIAFLNLASDFQRQIAGPNVYFERCYVRAGFSLDWDGLAAVIRELGVSCTVVATDLGQPDNPDPVSGLIEMLECLGRRGFGQNELETMACRNPAALLGLD